jgi:hypothetical protein
VTTDGHPGLARSTDSAAQCCGQTFPGLHAPKQAQVIWRTGTKSHSHPTALPPEIDASTTMAAGYLRPTHENIYHTSIASLEHLEFLEGGFLSQERQVHQFYFKKNDQPVFYINNFRDPLEFEATAYSSDAEDVWKPRWLMLLSTTHSTLGSNQLG